MEQSTKEELLSVLDEIEKFMCNEAETMYDNIDYDDEDWGVVKFSSLIRCIEKIRERHSLPQFQREK